MESSISARLRNLPLRTQLMIAFAFLSIATTAISTITLTTLHAQRRQSELRERSQRIAERLQQQLEAAAVLDSATVRALFAPYTRDRDLQGMAVYGENGGPVEAHGPVPALLRAADESLGAPKGYVTAVVKFTPRAGGAARLYLSFSTRWNDAALRRELWISAAIGGSIALFALILAGQTSRRISGRLVSIADAANRIASGDTSHARLDDSANDEIGVLAHSFNVMVDELNRLAAEYDGLASAERERLEALVSERTQALEQSREMFKLMAESTQAIPFTLDLAQNCFSYIGARGIAESGIPEANWKEPGALDIVIPRAVNPELRQRIDECRSGPFEFVSTLMRPGERRAEMRWTGTCELVANARVLRGLMLDITELRRLGRELTAAQKLESVGRLAAGVAHEINTPVQFVSDNVQFVRTSMTDLATIVNAYRELQAAVSSGTDPGVAALRAAETEKTADLEYLLENVPLALDSSIEGLGRIATIVRSMKEFAHPDQAQKKLADLNHAIRSTLVIAHNEYKYVADMETHFADLPPVQCHLGEINQVVLNLLVNASHAIADVVKDTAERGKLTVRTRLDGDAVEISIADTGTGIPEAIRDRIFDPFFTTKEVGKGTGQGLALAHNTIVIRHGGTLRCETECGKGTTFIIRLPINALEVAVATPVAA